MKGRDGHCRWKEEIASRLNLAFVSEQPDPTPYATVQDVIRLVCRLCSQTFACGRDALERAGLWEISGRSIPELSSGQRGRAVMAAAWIGSPKVVLLDEPPESMDRFVRREILAWIDGLILPEAAVVVATYNIEPFAAKTVRALAAAAGTFRLVESLPAEKTDLLALLRTLA